MRKRWRNVGVKVERGEGREKLRMACASEEGRRWTEGMRVCICALKEERSLTNDVIILK